MKYFSFLLLIFISILWGCNESNNNLNEGEIVYTIYYPEEDTNGLMYDMMPKEMNYTFTKHKTKSEISAAMGLFKSAYINDLKNNQLSQTVKMLNKKYQSTYLDNTFDRLNPKFSNLIIHFSDEQDSILGFLCNKAEFSLDGTGKTYAVYYTDKIGGSNPNSGTPFATIPGIMLKYTVENFGIIMEFTAHEIHKKKIDNSDFEIGEEYAVITPDELKNQIETIFQSVQ
jgi:GLPGLI family protein